MRTIRETDESQDSIGLAEIPSRSVRGAANFGVRMFHHFCGDNYKQFE